MAVGAIIAVVLVIATIILGALGWWISRLVKRNKNVPSTTVAPTVQQPITHQIKETPQTQKLQQNILQQQTSKLAELKKNAQSLLEQLQSIPEEVQTLQDVTT